MCKLGILMSIVRQVRQPYGSDMCSRQKPPVIRQSDVIN